MNIEQDIFNISKQVQDRIEKVRSREFESLIVKYLEQKPGVAAKDCQLVQTTICDHINGSKITWHIEQRLTREEPMCHNCGEPGNHYLPVWPADEEGIYKCKRKGK